MQSVCNKYVNHRPALSPLWHCEHSHESKSCVIPLRSFKCYRIELEIGVLELLSPLESKTFEKLERQAVRCWTRSCWSKYQNSMFYSIYFFRPTLWNICETLCAPSTTDVCRWTKNQSNERSLTQCYKAHPKPTAKTLTALSSLYRKRKVHTLDTYKINTFETHFLLVRINCTVEQLDCTCLLKLILFIARQVLL